MTTPPPTHSLHRHRVLRATSGTVAHLGFDNPPDGLMDRATLADLDRELAVIEQEAAAGLVRAVVFYGAVGDAFIRHHDVREIAAASQSGARNSTAEVHRIYSRVADLPVPSVAAINGACTGGGLEFALCCTLRYAASDAGPFGFPEISIGVLPGAGGTQRASRTIGQSRTVELMLTGRRFDAAEALRLGLVHAVSDDVLAHATRVAERLACRSVSAVRLIQILVASANDVPLQKGLEAEQAAFDTLINDAQTRETLGQIEAAGFPVVR